MRFNHLSIILAPFFAIASNLFYPNTSYASLQFCNTSSKQFSVAYASYAKYNHQWIATGWWTINPSGCKIVSNEDLRDWATNLYFNADFTDGSGGYGGATRFCASYDRFFLAQNDENIRHCGGVLPDNAPCNDNRLSTANKRILDKDKKPTLLAQCVSRNISTLWKGFREIDNTNYSKDFIIRLGN